MGIGDVLMQGNVYSNMHELNLDYIICVVMKSVEKVNGTSEDIEQFKNDIQVEFDSLKKTQEEQFAILKESWDKILEQLVNNIIPQLVMFNISPDGKLVAYIPEQWEKLQFFTDTSDFNSEDFGKLQIKYEGMWKKIE